MYLTQSLTVLFCGYRSLLEKTKAHCPKILASLLIPTFLLSPALHAAEANEFYALPRIGGLIIDTENIDDIQIVGVVVGLRISTALYIESELSASISGGDYIKSEENGSLAISTLSFYGAYRYVWNDTFYGKIKAGLAYNTFDYENVASSTIETSNDGYGAAGGVGIGYVYIVNAIPAMIELEYTTIDKNIDMITIGMTIPF